MKFYVVAALRKSRRRRAGRVSFTVPARLAFVTACESADGAREVAVGILSALDVPTCVYEFDAWRAMKV